MKICLACICTIALSLSTQAERRSLLNNDPNILYIKESLGKQINFLVGTTAKVYSSKTGGRQLGIYKAGTKVELIEITDKVYRVKGQATHGTVSGWVNPRNLLSKDVDFIDDLKALYDRYMIVKELISNETVAIGMTIEEVNQSLGEPTKKTSKITKDGRTGSWEYLQYEEEKNYNFVRDFRTGIVFKQFSHSTIEVTSKIVIDFENDVVTSIEESEDDGPGQVKIINPPITLHW